MVSKGGTVKIDLGDIDARIARIIGDIFLNY